MSLLVGGLSRVFSSGHRTKFRFLALFFFALTLLVLGLSARRSPLAAHPRTTAVTYWRDVAPILARRCNQCHTASGPGRLPLETYEQARTWAKSIREDVLERRMPPWPAATGFGDYLNDGRLTPIEIELLTAWADGSTPLGTATAASPPHTVLRHASLEYRIPADAARRSSSERFEITTAAKTDVWLSGWSFDAANPSAVQQIVFAIGGAPIGSWVPGDGPALYPAGVAQRLPRGASITADVHYNKGADGGMGGGSLLLYEGRPGAILKQRTLDCSATAIASDIQAVAITPLAAAGESIGVVARRPDGTVEPLNMVQESRPSYPVTYRFRKPIPLPRGTVVDVRSSAPDCAATLEFSARTPGPAASR